MSDLIRALTELREAREGYELAESFYEGRREEVFAGKVISRYFRNTGYKFSVNFAGRPVDAVLDRLEITAITADDSATTTVLNEQVWNDNELSIELPDIFKNAEIFGDAYLYVGPGDEDDTVEIFYNSPKTVRVFYDEENPRQKSFAIKAWEIADDTGKPVTRVNLYYPDRTEKFISKAGSKGERDVDFDHYIDDTTDGNGVVENEYGEIPFFHFRNARPYGRPRHANAFGPQDALTKLVINQMTTSDFAVFPQRWAIEDPAGETQDDIDFSDNAEDGPDEDNDSQLVSGPGTIMLLKNMKSIGQWTAAEADNFLAPMNWYVRAMSSSCSTPLHYFDPIGDAPSGESFRALEAPLIKMVQALHRSFTSTVRAAFKFALNSVLGFSVQQINVQWSNPQVIDDLQGWQAINEKIAAGVPRWQALMEAGYTEQQVRNWGLMDEPTADDGNDNDNNDQ